MRSHFLAFLTAILLPGLATAAVKTETVTYQHDGKEFKGFLAYDDASKEKRPGVMIVHEWWGLNDYARSRAKQLAEMGYVAFAVDMYGEGKTTEHPKEAAAMAGMVRKNEAEWLARASAGLKVLQKHEFVDGNKLAAIGYCFGGSTVLTMAHHQLPVKAVVSFHGALPVPTEEQAKNVKARVLICHGAADSFIPENVIQQVRDAYEKAKVDYQMSYFGNAVHSFTVPAADKVGIPGIAYNEAADRRSWAMMSQLFRESFGK